MNTPVIDAHHHLWDPARAVYPWMTAAIDPIIRRFNADDLAPLLTAAGVDGTIVVQARHDLVETRDLLATAAATPFILGVVGWVDLTGSDVAETIDRLRAAPGGERLVGVRHQVHDETDPDWLRRADVGRGLEAVEAAGLAFDLLIRPREFQAALDAIRDRPNLRFVLDHMGKPPLRDGDLGQWVAGLRGLAARPNVWCKLSGLVTEADWATWRIEDLAPPVAVALAAFGPQRVLFGSDWPVCLLAASYADVVRTAHELTARLGSSQQAAIFGGTARDVYGLPDPG